MLDDDSRQRVQNPERRASQIAREIMKPFRARVARSNDALVRIIVLKNRAERHLASTEIWRRQAVDLAAGVVEERVLFLEAVAKLPPQIASAPAVVNIDLATSRLLASLRALDPVRKHLAAQRLRHLRDCPKGCATAGEEITDGEQ